MKVAPLIRALQNAEGAEFELVYSGTATDSTLEESLFSDLQMPRPTVYLNVDSTRLNEITSRVMAEFDAYLESHPTDVVIVVDDLASTMAAAIVTKKRGIKLAHLVAGTRSFDINMPKEINRLVIDALSDYLFTAGVKSNSVATREQGETSQTYMVGNILMDTLRFNRQRLRCPSIPGVSLA
jgi:UDP-N-acetylglucosamine 2-epimerase (non-hydrolysing)